jgi:hypothetical protein
MLSVRIRKTPECLVIYLVKDQLYKHIVWDMWGVEINDRAIELIESSLNLLLENHLINMEKGIIDENETFIKGNKELLNGEKNNVA